MTVTDFAVDWLSPGPAAEIGNCHQFLLQIETEEIPPQVTLGQQLAAETSANVGTLVKNR